MMSTDYLEHHGVPNMKWGQRNGPPYPLTTWQQRAGDAVAKGKAIIKAEVNDYISRTKARRAAEIEKQRAEREDISKRRTDAAKRERLIRMAKKHPELLSDKELDDLNNRKSKENTFKSNYYPNKKKGDNIIGNAGKDLFKSAVKDVATPAMVALGKAVVASVIEESNLGDKTKERAVKALYTTNNNNNNNNSNNSNNKDNNKSNKPKLINKVFKIHRNKGNKGKGNGSS